MVLAAWDACEDRERAVRAAKWFLDVRKQGNPDKLSDFSYITLLRTCSYDTRDDDEALLGANVAIKIWQELFESDERNRIESNAVADAERDLPSQFYATFLHAIRCLPDRGRGSELRYHYFKKCFELACERGKVNTVVVHEFLVHARSKELSYHFLKPHLERIRGLQPHQAVPILVDRLPRDWTVRADKTPII